MRKVFTAVGGTLVLPVLHSPCLLSRQVLQVMRGWRYAITFSSVVAIAYGAFYYFRVSNTPKGSTYFKPKKTGAMEVTSGFDLVIYMAMNLPLFIALAVLAWKLSPTKMGLISEAVTHSIYVGLGLMYIVQVWKIWQVNAHVIKDSVPEMQRYQFKQVAILDWAYLVTFGAELTVVAVLATFYVEWFNLPKITAALLAGIYPFINLVARPGGGWMSDKAGRKLTLTLAFSGIAASFLTLGFVSTEWPIALVVVMTIIGGLFSQAGSGAVYAMVPLIQRRMTGQIAGMAGAFGNVGAVMFFDG